MLYAFGKDWRQAWRDISRARSEVRRRFFRAGLKTGSVRTILLVADLTYEASLLENDQVPGTG